MKNYSCLKSFLIFIFLGILSSCASRAPLTAEPINLNDGFPPSYVDIHAGIDFILIPAGSFMMRSPEDEKGRNNDESTKHRDTLNSFYVGKYELTQTQ